MPAALCAAIVTADRGLKRQITAGVSIGVILLTAACGGAEQLLSDQEKALTSLRATAATVGDSWLMGRIPTRYARTALDRTIQLLEQQRAELIAAPEVLADDRGSILSDKLQRLARAIVALRRAIVAGDSAAVHRALSEVAPTALAP
jgi:hypothetical protein